MQTERFMSRLCSYTLMAACASTTVGCMTPWFGSGKDDESLNPRREMIRGKLTSDERPRIVAEIGGERMLTLSQLENIGLVTGLQNTGGIVDASQPREKMLNVMRRNDVDSPNEILDAPSTAMVVAFSAIPPAARKGDRLDVSIRLSTHADATDLTGGWLMETSLVEMSKLGGQIREGFEYAKAVGPLVTRAQVTGKTDPDSMLEGFVIGGAKLLKEREMGIGIDSEFADAITMAAVVPAINQRFTVFDGRKQAGIATPVNDARISLNVPSKYALDPFHFINVVLHIGFNESEEQRILRMETLAKQLTEPTTVRTACWQLEAIGEPAIPYLLSALDTTNQEIRFYTAHSLAYLDDSRAIPHLTELCRREPAFRAMCLNALAVMDNFDAGDALQGLLHAADAETRYGALVALRHRDPGNAQVNGLVVEKVGNFIEIPSAGLPLIAVSLTKIPEVVVFGPNPQVTLPEFHYVTPQMILKPNNDGTVTISNFEPGKEDRTARVPSDLRSLLVGISDVGGTYGNWVSLIRECGEQGFVIEPVAMNPIPKAGRVYERDDQLTPKLEPGESFYERTIINPLEDESLDQEEENAALSSKRKSKDQASSQKAAWYNPFSW